MSRPVELNVFHQLAIALGLGLLIGLQREWAANEVAGIRTFPLIAVLGVLSAKLAEIYGGWIVAAAILSVASLLVMANLARMKRGQGKAGLTTEMAVMVMFVVGAALAAGYTAAAIAVGGGTAVLLHWKRPLHEFVRGMEEAEIKALIQVVLIALVILPVLPNRAYGPYQVLNPFQIWLMVVLIVGISLAAYVTYKLLGARVGTLLAGVLGGLISSTATSVSGARQTRRSPSGAGAAAIVVMIASTVVFTRVVFEIALVAPGALRETAPPLLAVMALMAVIAAAMYGLSRGRLAAPDEQQPPSELRAAIVFGLLYAVVIFVVAAAKENFGPRGMYVAAALSGLTDMDAITLSTAQLVRSDRLDADLGWRLILTGGMANVLFKGIAVAVLGHPKLVLRIAPAFAVTIAGGVLVIILWPGGG